jgi:phosphate transport system substrate-binding protein
MKTKTLLLALALYTSAGFAQKLKGSDTVLPLAQKEAENYMKANPSAKIIVTGGGSGVGLSSLVDGTTDIAMASRKIKLSEKMKLQDAGKAVKEVVIAFDALAVVVNPSNSVGQLTREQLEDIFTGKVKNWKEVGGTDMQIVVYSRETSSGTYEFFKEHVMNNKNYASSVLSMPATGSIIQSISQTKGAIGYVGLAYIEKDVKALKVSYDKGKTFTAPSLATAKDKSYPVIRPLFYYYISSSEKAVKPFVDYMLSAEGQKTVETIGYVPLAK